MFGVATASLSPHRVPRLLDPLNSGKRPERGSSARKPCLSYTVAEADSPQDPQMDADEWVELDVAREV